MNEFGVVTDSHLGCEGGDHDFDEGKHGDHQGDVIHNGGGDGAGPEDDQGRRQQVTLRSAHQELARFFKEPVVLQCTDEHKQPDEEENGAPFHFLQGGVHIDLADDHHEYRTGQGHNARLETREAAGEKAKNDEGQHGQATIEQAVVEDGQARLGHHDPPLRFYRSIQGCAKLEAGNGQADQGDDDHDGPEIDHEVVEAQGRGGADNDVGRITNQGCRTADVGENGQQDEDRRRPHFQQLGNQNGNGRNKDDGGHVVEKGRQDGGDQEELDHDLLRVPLGALGNGDGKPFQKAGLGQDTHDDHHADEQEEHIHIHALHGHLIGYQVEEDNGGSTGQGGGGFVDQFKGNQNIDGQENYEGENHVGNLVVEYAVEYRDAVDNAHEFAITYDENLGVALNGEFENNFEQGGIFGESSIILGHHIGGDTRL